MADLEANHLIKGGILVALLWYAWFRAGDDRERRRRIIVCTLAAAFVALAVNRAFSVALPFRIRPMYAPGIGFHPLSVAFAPDLENWSSFPSDHATFFFALVAGFFLLSRGLGIFAAFYALVIVCLPRVYLGVHYPSDIAAGAVIGVAVALPFLAPSAQGWAGRWIVPLAGRAPGPFYAVAFAVTYQMALMFDDVRHALHTLSWLMHEGGATRGEIVILGAALALLAALAGLTWRYRRRLAPHPKTGANGP